MYTSTGLGDMAVSNTIGSNVFDILVGLGVPWGIQTMAVNFGTVVSVTLFLDKYNWMKHSIIVNIKKNMMVTSIILLLSQVKINSRGLVYSVVLLLGSVALTVS